MDASRKVIAAKVSLSMPRLYINSPEPLTAPGESEGEGRRDEIGNDYVPLNAMVLDQELILFLERHLKTSGDVFWLVQRGRGCTYWHPVGRGQGCC